MEITVEDDRCSITAGVYALAQYDYEPPSPMCPGGEHIEIDHLIEMEVEMSWGDHELFFFLEDEDQIIAFLKAWDIDVTDGYDKRWGWGDA